MKLKAKSEKLKITAKKLKLYALRCSLSLFTLSPYLLLASPAAAQSPRPFRPGGPTPEVVPATPGAVADVATLKGLETIFFNVVAVSLALAGIAFFIMLVIGGFKLMTSGADRDKPQAAHNALTYAFFGLIVVISAFLILGFIGQFTGVDVTIFKVTQ